MRMASRAAGLTSTIQPRLPHQFAWRQSGVATHAPTANGFRSSGDSIRTGDQANSLAPRFERASGDLPAGYSQQQMRAAGDFSETHTTSAHPIESGADDRVRVQSEDVRWIPERTANGEELGDARELSTASRTRTSFADIEPGEAQSSPVSDLVPSNADSQNRADRKRTLEDRHSQVSVHQSLVTTEQSDGISVLDASKSPTSMVSGSTRTPSPTRRPEAREAEPPVEVKIGRVEVTFETPPQPAPAKRAVPRGFDDYAPLRRYSPQVWNRWRG